MQGTSENNILDQNIIVGVHSIYFTHKQEETPASFFGLNPKIVYRGGCISHLKEFQKKKKKKEKKKKKKKKNIYIYI